MVGRFTFSMLLPRETLSIFEKLYRCTRSQKPDPVLRPGVLRELSQASSSAIRKFGSAVVVVNTRMYSLAGHVQCSRLLRGWIFSGIGFGLPITLLPSPVLQLCKTWHFVKQWSRCCGHALSRGSLVRLKALCQTECHAHLQSTPCNPTASTEAACLSSVGTGLVSAGLLESSHGRL